MYQFITIQTKLLLTEFTFVPSDRGQVTELRVTECGGRRVKRGEGVETGETGRRV